MAMAGPAGSAEGVAASARALSLPWAAAGVRATPQGDSHGVGLKNVEAMMAQMHGRVRRSESGGSFCLTLYFPL